MALILAERSMWRPDLRRILTERGRTEPRFASSIEGALRAILVERPSLCLVDLLAVSYDFEQLRDLIARASPAPVIVVDDRPNVALASLAKWSGAAAYLTKDLDAETFRLALAAALEGAASSAHQDDQAHLRGLTPRQLEVLGELTLGRSNREIAEALGISVGTVKAHVHAVLAQIGARSRIHAALIGRQPPGPGEAAPLLPTQYRSPRA